MGYPVSLAVASGIALLGAGLGIQVGHSAIAEIDDGFYQSWDDYHSFAQYSAAHSGEYPGEESAGLGSEAPVPCLDCGGTGRYPWLEHAVFSDAELGIAPASGVEGYEPAYEEPVIEHPPEPVEQSPARDIDRYAYYPVDASDDADAIRARRDVAAAERQAPQQSLCSPGDACVPVGM